MRPPKLVRRVQPRFPESAPRRTGAGSYILEVVTDTHGEVADIRFLRKPGFDPPWPGHEEAITDAVRQWKYAPVVVDGVPTPIIFTVVVNICYR